MNIDIDDNNDNTDNNDNNYVTALLKDSYYFPVKLLVLPCKAWSESKQSYTKLLPSNWYSSHCKTPHHLSASGKKSMNFTNYINRHYQVVWKVREGEKWIVYSSNTEVRYLKNNIMRSI
jgi:hypothetical protein